MNMETGFARSFLLFIVVIKRYHLNAFTFLSNAGAKFKVLCKNVFKSLSEDNVKLQQTGLVKSCGYAKVLSEKLLL